VQRMENLDGYKFYLEGGPHLPVCGKCGESAKAPAAESWLLLRGSGTEPLLRVYAEAGSPEMLEQILDAAMAFVHQPATSQCGAPHLP
jgi:phosphomannomutase